jgi:Amt family ammonium transporter
VLEVFIGRVSAETEIADLDIPEMGQLGYPEFVLREESRDLHPCSARIRNNLHA